MAAPQLSVRSARARDLAHELSRAENRPIHAVVEDALVAYAARSSRSVSFKDFWSRAKAYIVEPEAGEPDLDDLINLNRVPHRGLDL
jgi:hypothetical protein